MQVAPPVRYSWWNCANTSGPEPPDFSVKLVSRDMRSTWSPIRSGRINSSVPPAQTRLVNRRIGGIKPPCAGNPSKPRSASSTISGARHQCSPEGAGSPMTVGVSARPRVAWNRFARAGVTTSVPRCCKLVHAAISSEVANSDASGEDGCVSFKAISRLHAVGSFPWCCVGNFRTRRSKPPLGVCSRRASGGKSPRCRRH